MRIRFFIALILFTFGAAPKVKALSLECENSLQLLFREEVTPSEASEFLSLQADITLHRLAWTYLKAQAADSDHKAARVEETIISLLNEKYTNPSPSFIKARKAFEEQPLSRATLAEIAPYLQEALATNFPEEDMLYKLNQSDLKLLGVLAKHEKRTARDGVFDHRMLNTNSPNGILNFTKMINSSYKLQKTSTEEDLNVESKLYGLESVLGKMNKRISALFNELQLPLPCQNDFTCSEDTSFGELFAKNEELQNILWKSLSETLESDDLLFEKLTYGDLWLQVKNERKSSIQKKSVAQRKAAISKASASKNAEPSVAQKVGLMIEDPLAIILKDKAGRKKESYKGFEKAYLNSMAEAIVADEKVFIYQDQMFDRQTGRKISFENALKKLSPKTQIQAKKSLEKASPALRSYLLKAWTNGNKTFVHNNVLYDLNGIKLDPKKVIAEAMSKKSGLTISPDRYKGLGHQYLVLRADALKNNKPYFKINNRTMDSFSGRDLSSPFRKIATLDNKIEKNRRRMYEDLSSEEVIKNFHRDFPQRDCGYYGVINKRLALITIYSSTGDKVFSSEILVGANSSDQRTRWTEYSSTKRVASHSTGAGVFTIRKQNTNDTFNKKNFNNNILSFNDENDKETVFAIHQVPVGLENRNTKFGTNDPADRRISGGCANLKLTDYKKIKSWLGPACKVYVLPEEEHNKFILQDQSLKFVSTKTLPLKERAYYNYSPSKGKSYPIEIKIVNKLGNTPEAQIFVKTLENEKENLMKIYRLSNDEYNDLAALAYGILGNESQFGSSLKLKAKEFRVLGLPYGQLQVVGLRALTGKDDPANTSRGLTQIKFLPKGALKEHYPEIFKGNLTNPRHSAIATIAYLAEAAQTMKNIAEKNKADPRKVKITKESMMDYLGYIYQGGTYKLTTTDVKKQATPELNQYFQGLQRNMSYLEISQKIE